HEPLFPPSVRRARPGPHAAGRAQAPAHRRRRLFLLRRPDCPRPAVPLRLRDPLGPAAAAGQRGPRPAGGALLVGRGHPAVRRPPRALETLAAAREPAAGVLPARPGAALRPRARTAARLPDRPIAGAAAGA